ncbi:MAG TPA: hypothetical protein PLF54_04795 [Deltaproteobacteria bacterium]|jgi:tetratricopeptide (TPR) repeat protein|nr:hypothetical protein [Deltaproteobacteria bacterium]HQJ08299.1 hypothetical protein [Deltaproteobacteria bacterium]
MKKRLVPFSRAGSVYGLVILTAAFVFIFLCHVAASPQSSGDELFFRANQAFREARYAEAAKDYEALIASGYAGGHLYYNLANACLKSDRLGVAILNYERARLLIPRDADLAFNLSYAQDRRTDAVQPPAQTISSVFFWLGSFNLPELFWTFAALNAALFAVLILRVFAKSDWSYYVFVTLLFLWLAGGVSFSLKLYETSSDDRCVVISRQADVLAGPQAGDTLLFRLHEGTVVHGERSDSGWKLISLQDGKRGWIRSADVGAIMDNRLRQKLIPW